MTIKGNYIQIRPDTDETVSIMGITYKKTSINKDGEVINVSESAQDMPEELKPGARVSYFPGQAEAEEDGTLIIPIENLIYIYP